MDPRLGCLAISNRPSAPASPSSPSRTDYPGGSPCLKTPTRVGVNPHNPTGAAIVGDLHEQVNGDQQLPVQGAILGGTPPGHHF
jgi:hypothetical protein